VAFKREAGKSDVWRTDEFRAKHLAGDFSVKATFRTELVVPAPIGSLLETVLVSRRRTSLGRYCRHSSSNATTRLNCYLLYEDNLLAIPCSYSGNCQLFAVIKIVTPNSYVTLKLTLVVSDRHLRNARSGDVTVLSIRSPTGYALYSRARVNFTGNYHAAVERVSDQASALPVAN
jgi:hypothetical protein